jgi:large repetitive protein
VTLMATGGTAPYTWSGSPANGLSLSSSGVISGTPSAGGNFSFSVQATDSLGASATANISVSVTGPLTITTGGVPGFQNYTYPATLLAASGGAPPYTWSGTLPAGMNVTSNGILTGLPTASGTATLTVTDSNSATNSAQFTIAPPTSLLVQGPGGVETINVSNIHLLSGTGPIQITATPGESVPLSFDYSLVEGNGDCPGCIDQIEAGFVGSVPTSCVYNGQPGPGGASGSAALTLTAPSAPGRYYVAYQFDQQFSCPNFPITASDHIIAVVDVIPTSVTFLNVTLTNINVTTPTVTAGSLNSVSATFTTNSPASGTFGLGYNVSPAPLLCGTLSLNASNTVTFNAPALSGRYYLSVDNLNTCNGTVFWNNGVPGSNFARFIGAVDVQ